MMRTLKRDLQFIYMEISNEYFQTERHILTYLLQFSQKTSRVDCKVLYVIYRV
jgi:hypothetical protein